MTDNAVCGAGTSSADAYALWDQARAALLASTVARDVRAADVTTLRYERTLDADGETVRRESRHVRTGTAARPFQAAGSATTLGTTGYMREVNGERTFFAPDADVLLDPTFAASHCFRVVRDPRLPGQIGLRVTPARERAGVVDVAGTLWMGEETPELRTFEFEYTSIDNARGDVRFGGAMRFATAANGVVVIADWVLRLPVLARSQEGPPSARRELRVAAVHESGGVLLRARWADSVGFDTRLPALRGTVRRPGDPATLETVQVALTVDGRPVAPDGAGRFAFEHVLPGRYVIVATDTALPGYAGERAARTTVRVRDGDASAVVELPAQGRMLAALCPPGRAAPGTVALVGRVRAPASDTALTVRVAWQDRIDVNAGGASVRNAGRDVTPDEAGEFHLCALPLERPVTLAVLRGAAPVRDTTVTILDSVPVAQLAWDLGAAPGARAATATLSGIVVDVAGDPVPRASIAIPTYGREGSTDAYGRFRFTQVPVAEARIVVRRTGYATLDVPVVVEPAGSSIQLTVQRAPAAGAAAPPPGR